jgi:hypothetical protein
MSEPNDDKPRMNGKPGAMTGLEQIAPDDERRDSQLPVESPSRVEVETPAVESEGHARLTPGAIFFGALVSLGFLGFVLLARVTVHPFDKIDRRMRVLDVWQRLRNHLPDVAHPTLLRVVFDVSIILIIVGSLACVWLALLAAGTKKTDQARADPPADSPALSSEH